TYKRRRLDSWRGAAPAPPAQWVHGDYQDSNVIFETASDEVAAVIDWDLVNGRSRAHEAMRAYRLSFPKGESAGMDFLRGYVEASDLDPSALSEFVDAWDYVEVHRTWPIDVRYERPHLYQQRWDDFITPPTDWWVTNREGLRSSLLEFAAARPR
ncbi:MAG TPA: phosphotransferase, partial [Dehalococcoidia bacterium]